VSCAGIAKVAFVTNAAALGASPDRAA